MSVVNIKKSGSEQFQKYLLRYKDQGHKEEKNDFYHVDIVAEAYNQGFSDGEKSGKKEFIENLIKDSTERFIQKANQVYILTNVAIDHIRKNGYEVNSFFINIAHSNPQAIIAVSNAQLLNDDFVQLAYLKIFELKKIFSKLFDSTFDIGLLGSDNLDIETLKEDHFDYSEFFDRNG